MELWDERNESDFVGLKWVDIAAAEVEVIRLGWCVEMDVVGRQCRCRRTYIGVVEAHSECVDGWSVCVNWVGLYRAAVLFATDCIGAQDDVTTHRLRCATRHFGRDNG